MAKYLARRILQIIPVLIIISVIVFLMVNVAGDPTSTLLPPTASDEERETLRDAMGLNEPLYVQYGIFISNAVKGDFGTSYKFRRSAMDVTLERMPASVELAGISLLFSVVLAIPLGIFER